MIQLSYNKRVSDFIDSADVGGNIKNHPIELQYLKSIDNSISKAGINTGTVYPFAGNGGDMEESFRFNLLDPSQIKLDWLGTPSGWNFNKEGVKPNGVDNYCKLIIPVDSTADDLILMSYTNERVSRDEVDMGSQDLQSYIMTNGFGTFSGLFTNNYILKQKRYNSNLVFKNGGNISFIGDTELTTESKSFANLLTTNFYLFTYTDANPLILGLDRPSSKRVQFIIISKNSITEQKGEILSHEITVAQRGKGRI